MKKLIKWIAIALGACVVLGVIASLATSKNGTSTPTPVAQAQPTTAAQPQSVAAKPTAVPPTAAPQAAACKVGEACTSAGVSLTVAKVQKADKFGAFAAKDGSTYVDIEVVIENQASDKEPYNPMYFKLKDADGYEYTTAIASADPSLKAGELTKGEKARGHVAFEVSTGAKGLVVSYEPLVLLANYKPIKIALE